MDYECIGVQPEASNEVTDRRLYSYIQIADCPYTKTSKTSGHQIIISKKRHGNVDVVIIMSIINGNHRRKGE